MEYIGKYIHEVDNNYSILLGKKHIEQMHLLLNFCVDIDRVNMTK
jgi:hypothetical protein